MRVYCQGLDVSRGTTRGSGVGGRALYGLGAASGSQHSLSRNATTGIGHVTESSASRTRRAASARPRPRSTWRPAWRGSASASCSSTSTRKATRPWARASTSARSTLSVYDVLLESATIAEARQAQPERRLRRARREPRAGGRRDRAGRPRAARQAAALAPWPPSAADYDFVLIDCPPSLSLLTLNGLASAHGVIVPMQCEYFALEGLSDLVNTIKQVHANLNPALEVIGILRVMFDAADHAAGAGQRSAQGALRRQGVRHRDPAQRPPRRSAELRHARASSSIRLPRARSPSSSSRARWPRAPPPGASGRLMTVTGRPLRRSTRLLCARIEDAGINASAPREQRWIDGWLVRLSPGKAKRARCIQAVAPGRLGIDEQAGALSAAVRRRRICRPTCASRPSPSRRGSIAHLAALGMERIDDTRVMVARIARSFRRRAPRATETLASSPSIRRSFRRMGRRARAARPRPSAARTPSASRQSPVPLSRGARARRARARSSPPARSRSKARSPASTTSSPPSRPAAAATASALCRHLLALAAPGRGATIGYLQVEAANEPARRVYRRLGFVDAYSYHYRTPPLARLRRTRRDAASRPVPSSMPRCTFIDCTAAPLAPLPRLSRRHISSTCVSLREHEQVDAIGVVAGLHVEVAVGERRRRRATA